MSAKGAMMTIQALEWDSTDPRALREFMEEAKALPRDYYETVMETLCTRLHALRGARVKFYRTV